jgi:hypothetical protein
MESLLPSTATELAQTLGVAVLLFFSVFIMGVLMIVYMRGENHKWEDRERHTASVYQSIIDQVTENRDKDFALLKATLDDNREQISINRGLLERAKQTESATRDIFEKLSRILEDRCRHHISINPTPKAP